MGRNLTTIFQHVQTDHNTMSMRFKLVLESGIEILPVMDGPRGGTSGGEGGGKAKILGSVVDCANCMGMLEFPASAPDLQTHFWAFCSIASRLSILLVCSLLVPQLARVSLRGDWVA